MTHPGRPVERRIPTRCVQAVGRRRVARAATMASRATPARRVTGAGKAEPARTAVPTERARTGIRRRRRQRTETAPRFLVCSLRAVGLAPQVPKVMMASPDKALAADTVPAV